MLKFNSQLFCKRGVSPCLMALFLLLATLDFFWHYFEVLQSLFLSLVKPAVNLNTVVTSAAFISAWTRSCVAHSPELSATREAMGVGWNCPKWCKIFKKCTRQALGKQGFELRWGTSNMRHNFRAECCVWASLALMLIHREPGFAVTGQKLACRCRDLCLWLAQINKNL